MRFRFRPSCADAVVVAVLVAPLAGCSTGPSQTYQTSNLAPRPENGMVRPAPNYAQASRRYVDPGHPTSREFAAASKQHDLGDRSIQTASIGREPRYSYDPQWRQPRPSGITTGSTGHASRQSHVPHVVEVREGDTLYSLSRRFNVPIRDLAAANRLNSERIVVGQHLVIPTRYR